MTQATIKEISGEEAAKLSKGNAYVDSSAGEHAFMVDNKYIVKGMYDEYCESPRELSNACGMFIFDTDRYSFIQEGINLDCDNVLKQVRKLQKDGYWILPIKMYIHDGIYLSLGREKGIVEDLDGIMFISKEKREEEGIKTKKHFERFAQGELQEYENYVNGNCYEFTIYNIETGEQDGSCGYIADSMEKGLEYFLESGIAI